MPSRVPPSPDTRKLPFTPQTSSMRAEVAGHWLSSSTVSCSEASIRSLLTLPVHDGPLPGRACDPTTPDEAGHVRLPSRNNSPMSCCGRQSARRSGPYSLKPLRRSVDYAFSDFGPCGPLLRHLGALATNIGELLRLMPLHRGLDRSGRCRMRPRVGYMLEIQSIKISVQRHQKRDRPIGYSRIDPLRTCPCLPFQPRRGHLEALHAMTVRACLMTVIRGYTATAPNAS